MPERVFYFNAPIGLLRITTTDQGLKSLDFWDGPADSASAQTSLEKTIARLLSAYFDGQGADFTQIPLDIESAGTPFQRRVWHVLQTIPYAQTRSYRWVAQMAGSPKGFRAVGQANRRNPIPIIIPCHRVIQQDGGLGGFSGMRRLPVKMQLLDLENTTALKGEVVHAPL